MLSGDDKDSNSCSSSAVVSSSVPHWPRYAGGVIVCGGINQAFRVELLVKLSRSIFRFFLFFYCPDPFFVLKFFKKPKQKKHVEGCGLSCQSLFFQFMLPLDKFSFGLTNLMTCNESGPSSAKLGQVEKFHGQVAFLLGVAWHFFNLGMLTGNYVTCIPSIKANHQVSLHSPYYNELVVIRWDAWHCIVLYIFGFNVVSPCSSSLESQGFVKIESSSNFYPQYGTGDCTSASAVLTALFLPILGVNGSWLLLIFGLLALGFGMGGTRATLVCHLVLSY